MNPLTIKQLKRFRQMKRGFYSTIIFVVLIVFAFTAEFFINNKALLVKYNGKFYFPVVSKMRSGTFFGKDYSYETNYKELKKSFAGTDNFVILPIVPYNPFENDFKTDSHPPYPPSFADRHYLGTDTTGRDILARIVYGFRIAIIFSATILLMNYLVGITLGCIMGKKGGMFDLFFQRIIEIWSNMPMLFIIIIISSILRPSLLILTVIMFIFTWVILTWQFRTQTYKEKAKEYILAVTSLGASSGRIIFKHIIPNSISLIVTFAPFSLASGMTMLTSLDYLGFGLPAPTPSWGELLKMGRDNLQHIWIMASVTCSMILILSLVTFIGEAVREAFDPKQYTTYE